MQILVIRSQAFYRVDLQTTTKKIMKKCSGHSMQQGFGQQRTALPNKLQRYARMHTWSPWPLLIEHMAQTHASRLTIFICSVQLPSEMIILTLPRRESF